MREKSALLLISLFFVACPARDVERAPPTQVARVDAPVRTDRTRYVLQDGPQGLETTIVATLKAPSDQILYLVNCNGAITTGLQRLVGNEWVNAWIPPINGCLSPAIEIPPGGETTQKMVVRPGPVVYPPNGNQLESGTYRAAWFNILTSFDPNARPFGEELPLEQRVSAPFTIEVPVAATSAPANPAQSPDSQAN